MKKLALSLVLTAFAGPALAHTGHGDADGLLHGLMHPVLGPDHLLAMLAVGLWSGFVLPGRFWIGAAAFLSAMTLGAGLAWSGVQIPAVESMILTSVVAFGLLVLFARPGQSATATGVSLAAIAAFAVAHGQAHAIEAGGAATLYLAGFLISTAALHLVGIVLARSVARDRAVALVQSALGALTAASGVWMLVG
jgi:urease accessory protein